MVFDFVFLVDIIVLEIYFVDVIIEDDLKSNSIVWFVFVKFYFGFKKLLDGVIEVEFFFKIFLFFNIWMGNSVFCDIILFVSYEGN